MGFSLVPLWCINFRKTEASVGVLLSENDTGRVRNFASRSAGLVTIQDLLDLLNLRCAGLLQQYLLAEKLGRDTTPAAARSLLTAPPVLVLFSWSSLSDSSSVPESSLSEEVTRVDFASLRRHVVVLARHHPLRRQLKREITHRDAVIKEFLGKARPNALDVA